ncbi:SMI1/KNR4 family protein [Melghirimyces profundicolus]|uniref:SMI1/KNR4 family protein n=1 Tax=Melghirimyces profundicolus TaxID=1242148 RepID=UPI0011B25DA4|nr:SMI1/KNR4 family protein [Melghirimyces profundicolus]
MLSDYIEFLRECNGATFGSIILFSWDELSEEEWRLWGMEEETKNWICIGVTLSDEVIALNKYDGSVHLFHQGPPFQHLGVLGKDFNEFLGDYVFGIKYLDISCGDKDDWYQILKNF